MFHFTRHPKLSESPFGAITAYNVSGVSNMGISLTPLFYPPQAYAIEYNAQTGFFIEFELGTTAKTTRNPNIATFHFVLYQHTPEVGAALGGAALPELLPGLVRADGVGRELVRGDAE